MRQWLRDAGFSGDELNMKDNLYIQFINEESPKHPSYEAETRADYHEQVAINYDLFASWLIKHFNTRPNDAKWISVEDEPKENGHYQIWDNGYGEGLFHDGEWKSTDRPAKNAMGVQCLRVTLHPTHYMPLPTPPKQSSEVEGI